MTDIEIEQIDSVYIRVNSEKGIARELSDFFSFYVPNYQYTPAYKNKLWDGIIRLFNLHTRTLYAGLIDYVYTFAKEKGYTITPPHRKHPKLETRDSIMKYITEELDPRRGDEQLIPHEHQLNSIVHAINSSRCLILSPTGSGKSFIIYALMRYYMKHFTKNNKKILIVVPTTNLVAQLYDDFRDYSAGTNWSVEDHVHQVYAGKSKDTNKSVVITTWQSMYKQPYSYFEDFSVVFGDEAHLWKAKSLATLMSKIKSSPIRIATTGTLDGSLTHKLVIEGLFGRVYRSISTKDLISQQLLSHLEIDQIILRYPEAEVAETKRMKYMDEIKWLISNQRRNEFIVSLCGKADGNTMLLFNYVELHGKPLFEALRKRYPDRKVFFIHGGTDIEQRERIRKIINREKNAILVASYGTCSTGINIVNIRNVVFASPSKSVVRVLQSIGRGLRRSSSKTHMRLFDIADDLTSGKYVNHTYKHMNERRKIYNKEEFSYRKVPVRLEGEIL